MEWQTEDLLYQLALWRIPEIGPARFFAILKQFPQLKDFFDLSFADLYALGFKDETIQFLKKNSLRCAERDFHWQNGRDKHILSFYSSDYPFLLKEIPAAPPLLFVEGDKQCLNDFQIGMVGSRNPSKHGIELAEKFARELASRGLLITSGFARGIDGASHEGALATGAKTIAVMGAGLDIIYPQRHRSLAKKVVESGAMVSEFPIGTPPKAQNFPRRNRIISGLSRGILVVEAALKSGSLITAHYAVEQGREVFALPGSIMQPFSKGCHQLIRQGAKLVETVEDILQELRLPKIVIESTQVIDISMAQDKHQRSVTLTQAQQNLLKCLTFATMPIDSIIERSKLTAQEVIAALLDLELAGIVSAVPGGYQLNQ